jgi:hypothetical protein
MESLEKRKFIKNLGLFFGSTLMTSFFTVSVRGTLEKANAGL